MPCTKVVVNLPDAPSYDVRIGDGILADLPQRLGRYAPDASRVVMATDSTLPAVCRCRACGNQGRGVSDDEYYRARR